MGGKEKKTWHKEEQVGIEDKLLSLVSWQYPATLVGVWSESKSISRMQNVCIRYGAVLGKCRGQSEHSTTAPER